MDDRPENLVLAREMLGDLLDLRGYAAATDRDRDISDAHLADVAMLPSPLVAFVRDAGLAGVIVGPGSVADLTDFPHAINRTRLHMSPGVYDRTRAIIVMGTHGHDPLTEHNLLHEFGHAVGHLLGLNDHPTLIEHHSNLNVWMRLPAYYRGIRPGDEVGRAELFAEVFPERIVMGVSISRRFGPAFVRWLDRELEL